MSDIAYIPHSKLEPFNAPSAARVNAWDLPRGQHGLAHETIQASQRARMLYAVVVSAAERGYASFTVADICRIAHVSRKTFYEQFSNREDCFLAAYETGQSSLIRTLREAISTVAHSGYDWDGQMRAAIRACLLFLKENPELARMLLLEVRGAGDRVWAVRDVGHERIARLLRALYRARPADNMMFAGNRAKPLPNEFFPALIGAVEGLLMPYIRNRRAHQLLNAESALNHLLLSMWAGHALLPSADITGNPLLISFEGKETLHTDALRSDARADRTLERFPAPLNDTRHADAVRTALR